MCTDGADVTKYKMSRLKEWWGETYKDGLRGFHQEEESSGAGSRHTQRRKNGGG